jgi:hypothetical protein
MPSKLVRQQYPRVFDTAFWFSKTRQIRTSFVVSKLI